MRKWMISYARTADAKVCTDVEWVNTRMLNKMRKLPWIKIFECKELTQ